MSENVILSTGAVLRPMLLEYIEEVEVSHKRPVMIVCPGGGYVHLSNREAEPVAIRFNALGYHAFVLRYHVNGAIYPTQLLEVAESVLYVRKHAEEFHADPDQIFVCGFSAGGHLAADMCVEWFEDDLRKLVSKNVGYEVTSDDLKVNGGVLCYPVISSGRFAHRGSFEFLINGHDVIPENGEYIRVNDNDEIETSSSRPELYKMLSLENRVSEKTAPCFIWHTFSDATVPVENSLMFATELRKHNVPFGLQIYPKGCHGLSLSTEETAVIGREKMIYEDSAHWPEFADSFLRATVINK